MTTFAASAAAAAAVASTAGRAAVSDAVTAILAAVAAAAATATASAAAKAATVFVNNLHHRQIDSIDNNISRHHCPALTADSLIRRNKKNESNSTAAAVQLETNLPEQFSDCLQF